MAISLLNSLLEGISSLFQLSSFESIKCEPVQKNHQKVEEILKLLKPILDAIVDAEIASNEMLQKEFAGLQQSVDDLREIFENWQPLMSKVYVVLQVNSLTAKIQTHGLGSLELLRSSDQCLPAELNTASLELCVQKIKHMEPEQTSLIIAKAIKDQVEGSGASSDSLAHVADKLSLKSNLELLIEAVALEKLKENAEQAENIGEIEYVDQMIALVTHMHDLFVSKKQSQICNPFPIPADFCCPLSLELMIDPVIVSSGQTYERAFIRKWIDLGLTVCPKTRQSLVHTNFIPNYTIRALIKNWCELKNVKLPDPTKSINAPLASAESVGIGRVNSSDTPDRPLCSPIKSSISSRANYRQEGAVPPLMTLLLSGTPRAREKVMAISLLNSLLEGISSLFQLSSFESIKCEPVQKNHRKVEEILKLLKPILDAIVDAEIASDEMLQKEFAGLQQSVDDLREIFENWQPLMSKVYIVLQVNSLTAKIQTHGLGSLELLRSSDQCLPAELNTASLELCVQKIKHMESEQTSLIIAKAIKDQVEGSGASSDSLAHVADKLSLKSNLELLIEAVALEKLKENAEQAENIGEIEYVDQMIALVTHMHDLFVSKKQSQICNPFPIPADFCCPLSLELMIDPVIVSSGQTYERAFIRKWIDLGLTVCPKTRQSLVHTNFIPNYTIRALIKNWCELKNVKLPDPTKSINAPLASAESVGIRRVNSSDTPDRPLGSPIKSSISSRANYRQEGAVNNTIAVRDTKSQRKGSCTSCPLQKLLPR